MLIDQQCARTAVLWLAAGGGGVIGFFVGRGTVSQSQAVIGLSEALAAQHRITAAAPIIATGITASSAIIGSCLCCCSVWWVIHWTARKQESRHGQP